METLIEYIAKGLVDDPDEVDVRLTETDDNDVEIYELTTASDDLGKVIGRRGRTAQAIRAVVAAASARTGRKAHVEIVD
ncbi:MAG: KH domain-containing protein [Myxococcota bacterium]